MRHLDVLLLAVGVFDNGNGLRHVVLALRHDFDESALQSRSNDDSVLSEEIVLESLTNHITASNNVALLKELAWVEVVKPVLVKRWHIDTTRDENTLGNLGNGLQWSLNSVKNGLEDA